MNKSLPHIFLLTGAFVWCAMLFMPPVLTSMYLPYGHVGYKIFSIVCHQDDARSLHIGGYPLAVCARCFAIYTGFFLGALISRLRSNAGSSHVVWYWLVAILPMTVDVAGDLAGLWHSTLVSRMMTGAFFGIAAALVLSPIIEAGLSEFIDKQQIRQETSYES